MKTIALYAKLFYNRVVDLSKEGLHWQVKVWLNTCTPSLKMGTEVLLAFRNTEVAKCIKTCIKIYIKTILHKRTPAF